MRSLPGVQLRSSACTSLPMASLFDVAAGLSQYSDEHGPGKAKLQALHPQSALGILDETFENIYAARRQPPLLRSASMVQLQPTGLSESKSSAALDARLKRLASFTSSTDAPARRVVPAIAAAGLIIPPPPALPPPSRKQKDAADKDPDVTAKAVLREVTGELDQLMATNTRSAEEDESLLRMLSDKYSHGRLSKLPGTPFVLLVRKKVTQKLAQLENRLDTRRSASKPAATEDEESNNKEGTRAHSVSIEGLSTSGSMQRLTPAQHEMLQNLLRLPEKQLLKLPKAQLELVQFAKRYDKLVKATPDQLRHLPMAHQHLVRSMQHHRRQLQPARPDERR